MLDASVLFSPVDQAASNIAKQQTLPSPSTQGVMRFEQILNQDSALGENTSVTPANGQLLQLKETDKPETADFKQAAINAIADMDSSYHGMLGQFANMPKFNEYVAEKIGASDSKQMRSYPDVSAQSNGGKKLPDMVSSTKDYMSAALEYNGMMTRWTMNSNMWMSKFSLISSAVNQVSQGFKTLFRTGG
jgi:hypothetical protein